jgi:hypothetical protein
MSLSLKTGFAGEWHFAGELFFEFLQDEPK